MTLQLPGSRFTDFQTSTEGPKNRLGERILDAGKLYEYVKNVEGGALTANKLVKYDETELDGTSVQLTDAADTNVAGVSLSAIPDDGFGWIQKSGVADVDMDGAGADTVVGNLIMSHGTDGECQGVDATVAAEVAAACGIALQASTTDATIKVMLKGLV